MSNAIDVSYITDSTATTSSTSTSTASQTLDSDTFLTLLVAQLTNQDPSSPMDTSDMMSQTTSLAMMESLTTIQSAISEQFALQMRMASADMVGQQITWEDSAGDTQSGVVDSVDFSSSVPVLKVGSEEIPLDSVASISPVTATTTTA
ncbi:MAG TPA: flagellar hook capping FlgD N-terminal domain-containing protein [Cellulomonas sp.]